MKEYAAQAMPIAFLAMHEDVSTGVRWDSDSAGVESVTSQEMLETWEEVSCIVYFIIEISISSSTENVTYLCASASLKNYHKILEKIGLKCAANFLPFDRKLFDG